MPGKVRRWTERVGLIIVAALGIVFVTLDALGMLDRFADDGTVAKTTFLILSTVTRRVRRAVAADGAVAATLGLLPPASCPRREIPAAGNGFTAVAHHSDQLGMRLSQLAESAGTQAAFIRVEEAVLKLKNGFYDQFLHPVS